MAKMKKHAEWMEREQRMRHWADLRSKLKRSKLTLTRRSWPRNVYRTAAGCNYQWDIAGFAAIDR